MPYSGSPTGPGGVLAAHHPAPHVPGDRRDQAHPGQQGADGQLPPTRADGQYDLDPRRDAGDAGDLLQDHQGDRGRRAAPGSRTAAALRGGSGAAGRSPGRWEQLIPAACMNVASPSSSAQSRSHVVRSRGVPPGQPPPASSLPRSADW